jgi:ferredoxin, 2Fe-2S
MLRWTKPIGNAVSISAGINHCSVVTSITINFIAARAIEQGATGRISTKIGQSIMQGATSAGIDGIAADCGGSLTCATCHVIVDPAWASALPPPSADELVMLDMTAAPRLPTSRLSCQIVATSALDGMVITLPETQY